MDSRSAPIFRFSHHFEEQLVERGFDSHIYHQIFQEPDEHYHDTVSGTEAAVKAILYKGTVRDVLLVYRFEEEGSVVLITIHPLKTNQKERRIARGRWVRG